MTTRDRITDQIGDAIFLEPAAFDEAIIGVAERCGMQAVTCYDRTKCIDILARDMPREDAEEFFEFNTIGAYLGEFTPMFVDMRPAE
jgi:hypothetical protein